MKILLLTRAHILKNRPASWIFSLLIALTAVLLQASFALDRSFQELFERVSLETDSAGFAEIIPQDFYESRREISL